MENINCWSKILEAHFFHAGTSYGPPIIYEILHENGQPFSSGKTTGSGKDVCERPELWPSYFKVRCLMSLIVKAYVRRAGSQNSNMAGNTFIGINCAVSTPHTEITCLTEQGAGSFLLA